MSDSIKNNLCTKCMKLKALALKNETQMKYKQYRNSFSTLLKQNERSSFTNYFQNNLNDLNSTWKGLKKLIPLKESPNIASYLIFDNDRSTG